METQNQQHETTKKPKRRGRKSNKQLFAENTTFFVDYLNKNDSDKVLGDVLEKLKNTKLGGVN